MEVRHLQATASSTTDKAGWTLREYLPLISIGMTKFYALPEDQRPHSVRIGKRLIIRETPRDYLARLAQMQETA
jgi:hypothetical protein